MTSAAWLILAVGNPSRGDDALGPALLDRLRTDGLDDARDVELLTDFQLQIEHALDLQGRRGVLFVDAARPEAGTGTGVTPIVAATWRLPGSHALRPQTVLQVAEQITGQAPPAWQLAIEGQGFALGDGLSLLARQQLDRATLLAKAWLQARRGMQAQRAGAQVRQGDA